MRILILNGSPRKNGTVFRLLKVMADVLIQKYDVEWIDLYTSELKPCIACMKCRTEGECSLPEDDAHRIGQAISSADCLLIGSPTHWGNMSAQLKLLFDRNVPVFMGEKSNGLPFQMQKGKKAAIVTACSTPRPLNFLANESRGTVNALRKILNRGGYRIMGTLVQSGNRVSQRSHERYIQKAVKIGMRF